MFSCSWKVRDRKMAVMSRDGERAGEGRSVADGARLFTWKKKESARKMGVMYLRGSSGGKR